jgi:hypothetical protein
LSLEIDHQNGNNEDNRKENLVALCPNCHSITPTWRGRNKSKRNFRSITDQEIINMSKQCKNIRQLLINLGLAPKGNNYKRIAKVLGL